MEKRSFLLLVQQAVDPLIVRASSREGRELASSVAKRLVELHVAPRHISTELWGAADLGIRRGGEAFWALLALMEVMVGGERFVVFGQC